MSVDLGVEETLGLVAEAVSKGECVLFLGAGVHAPPPSHSRFEYPAEDRPPIGSSLSRSLAASLNLAERHPKENPANLQRVSLFYEIERSRHQLIDAVKEAVHTGKKPSPMLRALAELDFPLIITTNYDHLLEKALLRAGKDEPELAVYNRGSYARMRRRSHPSATGGVQDPRRRIGSGIYRDHGRGLHPVRSADEQQGAV